MMAPPDTDNEKDRKKLIVGFVVLTWNSERFVENCFSSIIRLSVVKPVIRVVDNGSSDNTLRMLNALESHENFKVLAQGRNLGTTVSRNLGIRDLPDSVDYICILDSDTIINDAAISRMIRVLEADNSIGIVGPTMRSSDGTLQLSGRNLPTLGIKLRKAIPHKGISAKGGSLEIPSTPIVDGIQDVPYLLSACWLMPRHVVDMVGQLDERIFYAPEDVDYCVRCWKTNYRVVRCWEAEITHDYQRLSKKKFISKLNFEHIKGLAYYFIKHRYLIKPITTTENARRTHNNEGFLR